LNWIDTAILGCLAFGAGIGWFRGFIKMALGIIGLFAALLAAVFGSGPLTAWAERSLGLTDVTSSAISSHLDIPASAGEIRALPPSPEGFGEVLSGLGLPSILSGTFHKFLDALWILQGPGEHPSLGAFILEGMSHMVLVSLAFFLIFVAVRLAIWFLASGLTTTVNASFLGSVNRSLGVLLGLAQYTLLISILAGFATALGAIMPSSGLWGAMAASRLVPFFLPVFSSLVSFASSFWG
jgi:uncharacterized membrane protein required for colicin V production